MRRFRWHHSQDAAGGEDLTHGGVICPAVHRKNHSPDLVAAVVEVPERMQEPRHGVRDHDELGGRLRALHQHQQEVEHQRQRNVLQVVAVDVVQRGLGEVLLGFARGHLGAARGLFSEEEVPLVGGAWK